MEEEEEVMEIDDRGYEVEMNWNICRYLPVDGSCQEIFKVIIAGHIQALYEHLLSQQTEPGSTPIQRKTGSSQSQVRDINYYLLMCHVTVTRSTKRTQ